MPFYTFVMDYRGGTYVSQLAAPSASAALVKGAKNLDAREIFGFGGKAKEALIKQMEEDEPADLAGLINVSCQTAIVRGQLAVITLVQTDNSTK